MANIGTTTAFYKVETSLTRANNEVSKSMERLATGRQNANAGDRSSYVAMADTFRLDFVGTKAGIKGASVVMGYLETGMRVLDAASALLSRLQELAVLGANQTNTTADVDAIDFEAEAIADEFHRLMTTSTYKGKDVFVTTAGSEYVSLGGRDAEMTSASLILLILNCTTQRRQQLVQIRRQLKLVVFIKRQKQALTFLQEVLHLQHSMGLLSRPKHRLVILLQSLRNWVITLCTHLAKVLIPLQIL